MFEFYFLLSNVMARDQLIVINNNTLAVIFPERPTSAQVLRASVLSGSFERDGDIVPIKGKDVRLAKAKDFEVFRVVFDGFNNPAQYEFDPVE